MSNKHYLKYKKKYLDIKHVNTYKFIHPDDSGEMVEKLLNQIVKLCDECFPPNTDNNERIKIFNEKMEKIYLWYKNSDWFFAFSHDDVLIGYCFVFQQQVVNYTDNIKTYTKVKLNNDPMINRTNNITPYISSLCKDKNYPNVGSFLLNNVSDYLHKTLKHNIVYLCPGSDYYRYNYEAYVLGNECSLIDENKFYDANMKLINYYKHNGFNISPDLYLIINCKKNYEYIFYNVMYKNLN